MVLFSFPLDESQLDLFRPAASVHRVADGDDLRIFDRQQERPAVF
jgi:hypothetical protein